MAIPGRYTYTAMALHWLIAFGMIVNVILVNVVDALPEGMIRPTIDTHKSIGITVMGLALLRLLWRFAHRPPDLPASYAGWERWASHAAHLALYGLMFALPLSGWMHDSAWKDAAAHPAYLYWTVPWPQVWFIADLDPVTKETMHSLFGTVHSLLGYALYGLLALHILGALKHQWWDREPELQRMWPL